MKYYFVLGKKSAKSDIMQETAGKKTGVVGISHKSRPDSLVIKQ